MNLSRDEVISWAIEKGFLRKQLCCGSLMRFQKLSKNKVDGVCWRCNKCSKYKSIRKDSFFENFCNIELRIICDIVFQYFSNRVPANECFKKFRENGIIIDKEVIGKIYSGLRLAIRRYILEYEEPFPAGSRVAIDESHFFTSRTGEQHWVLGIVDIDNEDHASYFCTTKRDKETLFPVVNYYVETNERNRSLIITDGWAAYNDLHELGYIHEIELHNKGFLKRFPHSTNPVERSWSAIKRLLSQYNGNYNESNLCYFIAEGVLRRKCEITKYSFVSALEDLLSDASISYS